ncbi:MAG: hypothetical protein U0446_10780 [Dehalococcoidia bacterium]
MLGGHTLILLAVALVILGARTLPRFYRGSVARSDASQGALYSEQLSSRFPLELGNADLEIFLRPEALEFGWRSWAVDRVRDAGSLNRFAFNDLLWVKLRPDEIVRLEPRRLSTPHFLLELVHPYVGLGFTGEKKFRIRGVRTGIFIRTTEGKRYWLATRHPDQLIAAIEAIRGTNDSPSER